jgi:hypothetical protein
MARSGDPQWTYVDQQSLLVSGSQDPSNLLSNDRHRQSWMPPDTDGRLFPGDAAQPWQAAPVVGFGTKRRPNGPVNLAGLACTTLHLQIYAASI